MSEIDKFNMLPKSQDIEQNQHKNPKETILTDQKSTEIKY